MESENGREFIKALEKDAYKEELILRVIVGLVALGVVVTMLVWGVPRLKAAINEAAVNQQKIEEQSRFAIVDDNGIRVVTDRLTGCKYIKPIYSDNAMTPLLDGNGKPSCER